MTTMIGAYGRVQRAMVDHALWDQRRLWLNYCPGIGPLSAPAAPRELGQMLRALTNSTGADLEKADLNQEILKGCEKMPTARL